VLGRFCSLLAILAVLGACSKRDEVPAVVDASFGTDADTVDSGAVDSGAVDSSTVDSGSDETDGGPMASVDADTDAPMERPCRVRPPADKDFKIVFVTSEVFTGNLGGIFGGDEACNRLASSVGIRADFKAWLSDSFVSPPVRFAQSTRPYALVDGTQVAADWGDLVDGSLDHPIDQDECGEPPPTGTHSAVCGGGSVIHPVMTGTYAAGRGDINNNCGDWTIDGETRAAVLLGNADAMDSQWTYTCTRGGTAMCDPTAPIYCFEQ